VTGGAAHPSVIALWQRYRLMEPGAGPDLPLIEHFCDTAEEADLCANLVVAGRKRATSSALAAYGGEPLPAPGKLLILTDWAGQAKALIRTTSVTIRRFGDVPEDFAALEGEGDGNLAFWRETHRAFWARTLGETPSNALPVICEEFELLLAADEVQENAAALRSN
jgi:uncharacterized protein YhfF